MRLLPRWQAQAVGAAAGRFDADEIADFIPTHSQQRPGTGMPHPGIGAGAGIDATLTLPGVVLELQFTFMLKDPMPTSLDPPITLLLTSRTRQEEPREGKEYDSTCK